MINLKFIRPHTLGVTFQNNYESYADAEKFIELKCEKLADQGWSLTEIKGSDSTSGVIECFNELVADTLIIKWVTVLESESE